MIWEVPGLQGIEETSRGVMALPRRLAILVVFWPMTCRILLGCVLPEDASPSLVILSGASVMKQLSNSSGFLPLASAGSFLGPIYFLGLARAAVSEHRCYAPAESHASGDDRCSRTLPAWTGSSRSVPFAPELVGAKTPVG